MEVLLAILGVLAPIILEIIRDELGRPNTAATSKPNTAFQSAYERAKRLPGYESLFR
jgi:hypothetical protein